MLILRSRQIEVLREAQLGAFRRVALRYLCGHYRRQHNLSGTTALARVVDVGLARSSAWSVHAAGAVISFLDHMMMLGAGFDDDPLVPWAGDILADPNYPDEIVRMDALHARSMRYLDEVAGPDSANVFRSIARALGHPTFQPGYSQDAAGDFHGASIVARIYPERLAQVGKREVDALLCIAAARATAHGLDAALGRVRYLCLMVLCGAGFATDPLFPWAADTLKSGLNDAEGGQLAAAAHSFGRACLESARTRPEDRAT